MNAIFLVHSGIKTLAPAPGNKVDQRDIYRKNSNVKGSEQLKNSGKKEVEKAPLRCLGLHPAPNSFRTTVLDLLSLRSWSLEQPTLPDKRPSATCSPSSEQSAQTVSFLSLYGAETTFLCC